MSGRESGWEGVDFKGFRIYPNFGCRERGGGGEDAAILPRGYQKSHAKAAKAGKVRILDV